jgi:hypothetical protein
MIRFIIVISANLILFSANGQWRKLASITSADRVTAVAVDRPGEFYVLDDQRTIRKYDRDGNPLATARFESQPIVFDPHDGARLFAYFPGNRIANINPSLSIIQSTSIDSAFAIQPFLICLAGDNGLVILDSADWSIKKINIKTGTLISEGSLPDFITTSAHFTTMREYQNFIFLLDQNAGIRIFNSLGKLLKTLPARGLKGFNFLGEELYYVDGSKLVFFDLFNAESRTEDLPEAVDFAIVTDERLLTIKEKLIQIFAVTP